MKKILLIILDGLGDEPIPDFQDKTPLEAAKTPGLDLWAEKGICGQVEVEAQGAMPTSEACHFALFGYDPEAYKVKRGVLTALGCGIQVKKGDVALRGNFATINERMDIIDRRAGRIKNPKALIKALKKIKIPGVKFLIKSAGEHRLGIVIRGKGLSPNVSDGDPHYAKLGSRAEKVRGLDNSQEAVYTAEVLNDFLEQAHQILRCHSENIEKREKGLVPANYILARGASFLSEFYSFEKKYGIKACCIAGKFLYQQIARMLGMELILVRGANGLFNTNLKGKIQQAKKSLKKYDFIFLHIKATDSLAEDGDYKRKKEFIERFDKELEILNDLDNTLIVLTCDHSTCSLLKRHCNKPCPVLVYGNGRDGVKSFSEASCEYGGLGKINQIDLMNKILELAEE